jgi:hypothetical protein
MDFKIVLLSATLFLTACGQSGEKTRNKEQEVKDKITKSVDTNAMPADPTFQKTETKELEDKLKGRWLRSDGDYLLDIFSVNPDGKVAVAYYNPRPINVESGAWAVKDQKVSLIVVLRDLNYPGSTYTLFYFPDEDILAGKYFQAIDKINYDVIFYRK